MRKLFVLACAVAILAGCMSSPFYSTIYGKANPSYSSENSDGSTLIEFKFILDPFDAKKAMQRIDEYLTGYAGEKGLAGYDVENVNGKTIEKSSRGAGSWVAPASSNFVLEPSYKMSVAGKDQYGRIRLQVRFNK